MSVLSKHVSCAQWLHGRDLERGNVSLEVLGVSRSANLDELFTSVASSTHEVVQSMNDAFSNDISDPNKILMPDSWPKMGRLWTPLPTASQFTDSWPDELPSYPSPEDLDDWLGEMGADSAPGASVSSGSGSILDSIGNSVISPSSATAPIALTVCGYDGHNFTVEVSRVYGRTHWLPPSRKLYISTISKALEDPLSGWTPEQRNEMAERILCFVVWEHRLAPVRLSSAIRSSLPNFGDSESGAQIRIERATDGIQWTLFVGRQPGRNEVSMTLRMEEEILLLSSPTQPLQNGHVVRTVQYRTIPLETPFFDDLEAVINAQQKKSGRRIILPGDKLTLSSVDVKRFLFSTPIPWQNENDCWYGKVELFLLFPALRTVARRFRALWELVAAKSCLLANKATASAKSSSLSVFTCPRNVSVQALGWGLDSFYSLGLASVSNTVLGENGEEEVDPAESIHLPRPVPFSRRLCVERVRLVACSSRHSLLLTHFGSVFSCGDNSEGALGLGDLIPRNSFTPIDWPTDPLYGNGRPADMGVGPRMVSYIAAGSGVIGSHSVAVDVSGRLYSWGFCKATGLGTLQQVTTPRVVRFPQLDVAPVMTSGDEDSLVEQSEDHTNVRITHVACGDAFTVCTSNDGHVYSWGQWAHGRLGLGQIPMVSVAKRGKSKLAKFQLRPVRILNVEGAVEVACGEAHTLCRLRSGHVLSWGQNSLGQLGLGFTMDGQLRDAFTPALLPSFGAAVIANPQTRTETQTEVLPEKTFPWLSSFVLPDSSKEYDDAMLCGVAGGVSYNATTKPIASSLVCGAFHSAVLDADGIVWTWGARGSPCLGHGDGIVRGPWARQINALFSLSTTETTSFVPYELRTWVSRWSLPRPLTMLRGMKIQQIVAGDLSTTLLTTEGRVLLCGSGPVVPPIISTNTLEDDVVDDEEKPQEAPIHTEVEEKHQVVSIPRLTTSFWMRELHTRRVQYLSGMGCRLFAMYENEVVTSELTSSLYNLLTNKNKSRDDDKDDPFKSLTGVSGDDVSLMDPTFAELNARGKADCVVIASGLVFLCHRALLARRSDELREMIIMESPLDPRDAPLVQILLPELHKDAAQSLLYFLYLDVLPTWATTDSTVLHSLSKCAKTLKLHRLRFLCDHFLKVITGDDGHSPDELVHDDILPPMTLIKDIGSLVGDDEFADVRFIAEGRAVMAHRFILEAQSEFFRRMFRSGMSETGQQLADTRTISDVVVPDTFVGLLRLLLFLYTHTLPDGSDGALLEDLLAADRYQLLDMRHVCEHSLVPSATNWLDVLRAADLLDSEYLRYCTRAFLRENLQILHRPDEFEEGEDVQTDETESPKVNKVDVDSCIEVLKEEFPEVLEEVLRLRAVCHPRPPSELVINEIEERRSQVDSLQSPFPLWALILALIAGFAYQYAAKVISLGWLIPVVNISITVMAAIMAYFHLLRPAPQRRRMT